MLNYKIPKKWLILMTVALISALSLAIASSASSIYLYGRSNNNIKADAAIVLGAAVWKEEPSPVFRERINHAINLYKNGFVKTIIFTGGVGESNEPAEAIVGKNYAIAHQVKAADILIETQSRTTHQNLKNALEVANAHQLTKFLIVSDPLHMKRAVLMARGLGMDAHSSPTPTTRYRSFRSQMEFLSRETYFYFVYLVFKI
ncbi:MAG: YdcF family protein [Nostoc sp. DedQUE08]|uniref:YdcF family protein n=1 Tax=unclassified Nostoc TaxID=2593658 RepID=UPI002AD4912F|nr:MULTISPECIES: YdcF family protein [unclassified Nostoc]MDZ8034459.1 YdcF family protein [Nostoc sp. DedSLP04]MDZ8065280.1 YdcF family protein [Nostoc sp. DedQUE08]MDZ8091881.1 YdcF family protein [Nostoc sp. DedQUE05]